VRYCEASWGIIQTLVTSAITASRHSSTLGLRLRLTDKRHLRVKGMKTRFGDRAFSAAGPSYCNSLPSVLRAADSVDSGLKTYNLFSRAYFAVG